MKLKRFLNRYFIWEWRPSLMAAICLIPAVLFAAFGNERAGIIGVMGILPAISADIRPKRKHRYIILVYGVVWVAAVWLGYLIKTNLNMLATAVLVAAIGAGMFLFAQKYKWAGIAFTMVVPVVCIGLNFTVPKTPIAFTQGMLPGSLLAYLVSLCFPEFEPPPSPSKPSGPQKPNWGFAARYAAGLFTAVGIGYNWDHTGWEASATAFTMRPSNETQKILAFSRMGAVIVGATLASLMLFANPPAIVVVLMASALMVLGGGIKHSRANVMPAFMTFNVFSLMLYPVTDDTLVEERYVERIVWVAIGLFVGFFFGMLLPWLWKRFRQWRGSNKTKRIE